MGGGIEVRRGGPADLSEVARLNALVQDLHHDNRPDTFVEGGTSPQRKLLRRWMREPGIFVHVAAVDGRTVGYVLTRRADFAATEFVRARAVLLLDQIAVDPDHRREGVGAALVAAVRGLASTLGIAGVELTVWSFNDAARSFFESQGFTPRHTTMELREQASGTQS